MLNLEHPLLAPYRNIRGRNWTEHSGIFIVEGPLLVERLLASDYPVKSVLLDRKFEQHYATMIPEPVDLLLVDHDLVEQIVGFKFHRGVLACGLRRRMLSVQTDFVDCSNHQETLVATWGVQDPENLGGIFRSCAALGLERVIIGPGTADPLSRRVLRVSMGTALRLKVYRSLDLLKDLQWLREAMNICSVATTLHPDSVPLERATRDGPVLVLLGNERNGLPPELQRAADYRVKIGMELETDSLNVCVAAGIVMHHFCQLA